MGGDVGKVLTWPFGKVLFPDKPSFEAPAQEPIESVSTVTEAATDTKKKIRKPTGRGDALLAGVANALKKRLGE